MSVRDCIIGKADLELVDRAKAQAAADRFDELVDEIGGNGGFNRREIERRAAVRLEKEMRAKAARRKRMRLKQAQAQQRIRERVEQAPAQVGQALLSLLEFDPRGVVHGENVAQMGEVIRGQAHAHAASFLEKFRSRAAGIFRSRDGMENVVRELFGEVTNDVDARAMTDGADVVTR